MTSEIGADYVHSPGTSPNWPADDGGLPQSAVCVCVCVCVCKVCVYPVQVHTLQKALNMSCDRHVTDHTHLALIIHPPLYLLPSGLYGTLDSCLRPPPLLLDSLTQ